MKTPEVPGERFPPSPSGNVTDTPHSPGEVADLNNHSIARPDKSVHDRYFYLCNLFRSKSCSIMKSFTSFVRQGQPYETVCRLKLFVPDAPENLVMPKRSVFVAAASPWRFISLKQSNCTPGRSSGIWIIEAWILMLSPPEGKNRFASFNGGGQAASKSRAGPVEYACVTRYRGISGKGLSARPGDKTLFGTANLFAAAFGR